MGVSWAKWAKTPGVNRAMFLLEALGETLFTYIFQLLEFSCIPWLVVLSSIFKASISNIFLTLTISASFHICGSCDYTGPTRII